MRILQPTILALAIVSHACSDQQRYTVPQSSAGDASAKVPDEEFDAETRLAADQGLELTFDPFMAVRKNSQTGCSVKILRQPSKGKATVDQTTGHIKYTPESAYTGPDSLLSLLSCENLSKKVRLTLDVKPVNHQPVVENLTLSINEDSRAEVDLKGSDPDKDQLTFFVATRPAKGTFDERKFSTGKLLYTPPEDFNGEVSFTYGATDGFWPSGTKTIKITVIPVRDRPVAYDATLNTAEDTPVNARLLGTSVDGQKLSFVLMGKPYNGDISNFNESTGEYTYTPKADVNGEDAFPYKVVIAGESDHDVINVSEGKLVTIRIAAVNDPVSSEDRSWIVDEDTTLSGIVPAANLDGDKLTYQIVQAPTHGTLRILDPAKGEFTYTPENDYNGSDSFVASVSDGSSTAASGGTITVKAVNDPPIAQETSFTIDEDKPLQNRLNGNDIENDALTWSICRPAKKGTVRITNTSTGDFTYTPAEDFNGSDTFLYKVSDRAISSECVPATVIVRSVMDRKIAVLSKRIEFGGAYDCPNTNDEQMLRPLGLGDPVTDDNGYFFRATKEGSLDLKAKLDLPPGTLQSWLIGPLPSGSMLVGAATDTYPYTSMLRFSAAGKLAGTFELEDLIQTVSADDGFYTLSRWAGPGTRVRKISHDGKLLHTFMIGYTVAATVQGARIITFAKQGYATELKRWNGDGTLDSSFAYAAGTLTLNDDPSDLSVDRSGRILVTGISTYPFPVQNKSFVARFEQSGALDTSFGDSGRVTFTGLKDPKTVRELPGGKILVGGTRDVMILNSTGEIFSDFSNGGIFTAEIFEGPEDYAFTHGCPMSDNSFVLYERYKTKLPPVFRLTAAPKPRLSTYRIIDPSLERLTRVSVTSPVEVAKAGVKVALTAAGVYGDAPATDLSRQAIWSSSNTSVATVDQSGLVTPVKSGQTQITATLADGVSASVTLPVEEPKVVSLSLNPDRMTIRPGDQAYFTVSALYEGGKTVDVTNGVSFAVSDPSKLKVGPGTVQGTGSGSVNVSVSFGGKSASLTVDSLPVLVLEISLPYPVADIIQGSAIQARATAKYSDNTSQDVTSKVSWSSSSASVATVTPAGYISGISIGSANIQASLGGTLAEKGIRVTEFSHLIFVTSKTFRANFGGVTGADAVCARSASEARLTGSWKAVLSSSTATAKDRLTIRGKVKTLNGDVIFNSATEMWSNAKVMIDQTEFGNSLTSFTGFPAVWTATAPDGTRSGGTCRDWTSTSFTAGYAVGGTTVSWGAGEWIQSERSGLLCEDKAHIYCVSQ